METPSTISRGFKGIWIPSELWFDSRLTPEEKIFAAEIDSLDHPERHCHASNAYFQEFFVCQERKIQDMLSKLKKLGFIEQVGFDGRIRRLKSNLKTVYTKFSTSNTQPENSSKHNLAPLPSVKCAPLPPRDFIERDNKAYNKEEEKEVRTPSSHSQARGLSKLLIEAIKKTKPDVKPPNLESWEKEIDRMMRLDKRSEASLKAVIEWLPTSSRGSNGFCWADNILSAESFRAQFDKLEISMRKDRSECPSNALELICRVTKLLDHGFKADIVVGAGYIDFKNLYDGYLKVSDPSFMERAKQMFRKIQVKEENISKLFAGF